MRNRCGSITLLPQASNSIRTPGPASSTLRLGGTHQSGIQFGRIEKIKDVGAIVACQPAQCADGGAHLRAFDCAQKADGDSGGGSDVGKADAALRAQLAQARPDRRQWRHCCGAGLIGALALQHFARWQQRSGRGPCAGSAPSSAGAHHRWCRDDIGSRCAADESGPDSSHPRIAEGEMPTRRATSPILR